MEPVSMAQTQESKTAAARRKATLSPELAEVLRMLKSLEAELDNRQAPAP